MTRRRLSCVLLLVVCAAGCGRDPDADGDDPMAALASQVPSTRYQAAFWSAERRQGSALWRSATSYCTPERAASNPNCQPVLANVRAERGNARADSLLRRAGTVTPAGTPQPRSPEFHP